MWSVVEFDDGVQLVPLRWVDTGNGTCKWPPFTNQNKTTKAIKDMAVPDETWISHKIRRIFVNADTYEIGIKKLRRAEDSSDMDSENEAYTKKTRKERARKLFSDDDDDDEGLETSKSINCSVRLTQIPLPKLSTTTPCNSNSNLFTTPSFPVNKSPSPTKTSCRTVELSTLSEPSSSQSLIASSPAMSSTPASSIGLNGNEKIRRKLSPFKKQGSRNLSPFKKRHESDGRRDLFKKLNSILYEVRKVEERVANIEKILTVGQNQQKDQLTEYFEGTLPLKSIEELNKMEESLKEDNGYFLKLVATLKMVGGYDSHQTVYNIMKRVLSNSVADTYSFIGAKKKLSFKSLHLNKVILASTRARHPDITEVQYSEAVSKWLVQAKLRLTREMSKEEKERQKQENKNAE